MGALGEELAGLGDASMAAALRFDSQYVELKGVAQGDQSIKVNAADAGDLIGQLPDSTAGAIAISGGESLIDTMWQQMGKAANGNLEQLTTTTPVLLGVGEIQIIGGT